MGVKVEFNPNFALRNISEHKNGQRKMEECIPELLEVGTIYDFLKDGQRIYWLGGEIPLTETKGNENLSRPKASVIILEVLHFSDGDKVFTKGKYKVTEVFDDRKIHFEGFEKIK